MELRTENRREQRVRRAGFSEYLQELVRKELPKDTQTALLKLKSLDFVKEGCNIVFGGNSYQTSPLVPNQIDPL